MYHREFENDKTSNEKNNPLTITSLPSELIELFSISLDMNSFLLMRFTCRLFCSALEQELLKRVRNSKPKQIAVGGGYLNEYLMVLYEDGTVSEHKLDIKNPESISTGNRKRLPNLPKIVQIAANMDYRFYLDVNGNVWCADNSYRENKQIEAPLPKLLSDVANVTQLTLSTVGALFLKGDGTVLAYGYLNPRYLSGGGKVPDDFKGTPLEELKAISGDICQIELTSNDASFFLKRDGTVWIRKAYAESLSEVTQIPGLAGITRMFIGDDYFFLKEDHSIWGYGYNLFGGLGVGHDKPISAPTLLSNLSNIRQVHSGIGFTFFIAEDGSLLHSGRSYLGVSQVPVLIPGLAGIKQVLGIRNKLIFILMDDGRILSVNSNELSKLHNSNKTTHKISCLNEWSNIYAQLSSKSELFHPSNNHETLETQEKDLETEKEVTEESGEKELEPQLYEVNVRERPTYTRKELVSQYTFEELQSLSILRKLIIKGKDAAREIAEKLEEHYKLGTLPKLLDKSPNHYWDSLLINSNALPFITRLEVLETIYLLLDENDRRHVEKQVFEAILDHSMESNWPLLVKALYLFQTHSQKETLASEMIEEESTEKETENQVQQLSSTHYVFNDTVQKEEDYLAFLKELATHSEISKRDSVNITLSFYIAFISKDVNALLDLAFSRECATFTQLFSETVTALSNFTDGLSEHRLFFKKFLICAQAQGFYLYNQCFDVVNKALEQEKLNPIRIIEFTPINNQEGPREPKEFEHHSLDKEDDIKQPEMEASEKEKETASVFLQATDKVQESVSSLFSAVSSVFFSAPASTEPKNADEEKEQEVSQPSSSSVLTSLSFSAIFGSKINEEKGSNEQDPASKQNGYQ